MGAMRYRGMIMDLDGCIYLDYVPIGGSVEALNRLRKLGVRVIYVTNNPETTSEELAERLSGLGVECSPEDFLTVGEAAASYIYSRSGASRVLVIAGDGVREYCKRMGHRVLGMDEWDKAEYVVAGFDREINYQKLVAGLRALLSGASFIGTNPDAIHPGRDGPEPGSGAFIAIFEYMTCIKPIIVGKPSEIIMEQALRRLRMKPEEVLVVGDRVDTDIRAGRLIGADTALVLTGVTREKDLPDIPLELKPTYVFRSLRELVEELYT
jgi:4-nitrophenyl phosphatase